MFLPRRTRGTKNKQFIKIGHECEMPEEPDPILKHFPGNNFKAKLKRWWYRNTLVSDRVVGRLLRSQPAIVTEKIRHIEKYSLVIHPFSNFHLYYTFFMMLIDVLQLIMVPIDAGYFTYVRKYTFLQSIHWKVTRLMLDLTCMLGIGISMTTGYYHHYRKEVVLEHSEIIRRYLRGMFVLDVLTSFPTHWELFYPSLSKDILKMMILQAVSLLKILRSVNFYRNIRSVAMILGLDYYVTEIGLISIMCILYLHFVNCAVPVYNIYGSYYAGNYERYYLRDIQPNYSAFKIYARNFYVGSVISAVSISGVGSSKNQTDISRANVVFWWSLSKFLQIVLMAKLLELLKSSNSPRLLYNKKMEQQIEFMRYKKLPLYTQKRIKKYFEYHYRYNFFREDEIFSTVSGQLRQEVVMYCCRKLVENVEFFQNIPFNLLVRIVACLRAETYMENDMICKADTVGDCMYFIASGTVALYTISGIEICHLEDGHHFGEVALLMEKSIRVASVIAIEICSVYRLDREDFNKAIRPYPDLLERIKNVASRRKEETEFIDAQFKRDHH